jgi:hypothetical protein
MRSGLAPPGKSWPVIINLFGSIMVVVFRSRQGGTFASAMEFVGLNPAISVLLFAAIRATSFKGVENCSWKRRALMLLTLSPTMVQLKTFQLNFLAAFQDNFWIHSTLCNDFLNVRCPWNVCVYDCSGFLLLGSGLDWAGSY